MGTHRVGCMLATLVVAVAAPSAQVVFEPANAVATFVGAGEVGVPTVGGDFDGNGTLDVALGIGSFGSSLRVLLNDGAGNFTQVDPGIPLGFAERLAAVDVDLDTHLDLVDGSSLYRGNGDGTFQPAVPIWSGATAVAAGLLDGDAAPDLIAFAPQCCFVPDADLVVLHGDGSGTFDAVQTLPSVITLVSLELADFDEDGDPDLFTMASTGSTAIEIFFGAGDGTFTSTLAIPVFGTRNQHVLDDFDADGHLDIAVTTGDVAQFEADGLTILLGNGDGTFAPATAMPLAFEPVGMAAADFDLDGSVDLGLFSADTSELHLLRGAGDGTFAPDVILSQTGPSAARFPVAGLIDGDRFPDLVFAPDFEELGGVASIAVVRNHTYGPDSPYGDLGGELAGTAGYPVLLGEGDLSAGAPFGWNLFHAEPGNPTFLVLGLSVLGLPFKGGVLIPTPDAILGPFSVDPQGSVLIEGPWPDLAGGYDVLLQHWIQDAGGPVGFAASPGLLISVPAGP